MKEEILDYFNNQSFGKKKKKLKVLDNRYRDAYTGVTLDYITYELLKAKYKKSEVAKTLLKLQKNSEIKSLFCPNINKYVFEPNTSCHYFFDNKTGSYTFSYSSKDKNVHEYLNKFINKKNE